jgi:hypothetical protein
MRAALFRVILWAVVAITCAEGAAWGVFEVFGTARLAVHWRIDSESVLSSVDLTSLENFRDQFFDPDLGWVFRQGTTAIPYATFGASGARTDPAQGPDGRISAYGDSFTFGQDAAADETWPHYLAKLAGVQVANFGVAGYGPDQAVLRLHRHLLGGQKPQVVVLGILSENIARVVNVWRAAYTPGEILNFKPILVIEQGVLQWIPPPLAAPDSVESVRRAIDSAQLHDIWLAQNQRRPPRPGFPYLWSALDTAAYLTNRVVRWQDLWRMDRPVEILTAVVDRFVALSAEYSFRPVLVFIPMGEDVRRRESGILPTYAAALSAVRLEYGASLTVVDILDEPFEAQQFYIEPFTGHASPYGNRTIAESIFRHLQ